MKAAHVNEMQTEGSHWPEMNVERRPIGLWLVSGCDVVGCCHGAEKSHQRVCTNRVRLDL